MAHLPLNMEGLEYYRADYVAEFMNAVSEWINQYHNIKNLTIKITEVVGEEGGQETGVRLAEVLASNNTIETLDLYRTQLIDKNNKEQWGNALLENKMITKLCGGIKWDVVEYLKAKTADRTPTLEIESY